MVYLIHFNEKYYHAQHYIGYTRSGRILPERISHHRQGHGAKLLEALNKHGIGYEVVRTWKDGNKTLERKLKNRKNASFLCPICQKARNRKAQDCNGKQSTTKETLKKKG